MKKTHVQVWREADTMAASDNNDIANKGYKRIDALISEWLGTEWRTMIGGKVIVGTLCTIEQYKFVTDSNIDPAFTLEFEDTNGYPMTITRHFEQFTPITPVK